MTLSSMRIAVATVFFSLAWSITCAIGRFRWCTRLTEPRLHTAISVSLVFSVISVHRLLECTTPTCCCGERTLQASLKVIQGWPVSNSIESILRHRSLRRHLLEQLDLAARRLVFVARVGVLEGLAELVVQVGAGARREQRPVATFHHPLHEQVGNPVRGVHVVRAAAVVAGVLAQLEELLDVEVPASPGRRRPRPCACRPG